LLKLLKITPKKLENNIKNSEVLLRNDRSTATSETDSAKNKSLVETKSDKDEINKLASELKSVEKCCQKFDSELSNIDENKLREELTNFFDLMSFQQESNSLGHFTVSKISLPTIKYDLISMLFTSDKVPNNLDENKEFKLDCIDSKTKEIIFSIPAAVIKIDEEMLQEAEELSKLIEKKMEEEGTKINNESKNSTKVENCKVIFLGVGLIGSKILENKKDYNLELVDVKDNVSVGRINFECNLQQLPEKTKNQSINIMMNFCKNMDFETVKYDNTNVVPSFMENSFEKMNPMKNLNLPAFEVKIPF